MSILDRMIKFFKQSYGINTLPNPGSPVMDFEEYATSLGFVIWNFDTYMNTPTVLMMKSSDINNFKACMAEYAGGYSPIFLFKRSVSGGFEYSIANNYICMIVKVSST